MKFIYALVDEQGRVRYVGCSGKPLHRFKQHLQPARYQAVSAWIKSLAYRPGLMLLRLCSDADASAVERQVVTRFRSLGADLLNKTDGGAGTPGWVPHTEFREKASRRFAGKPKSPEHRAKLAAHCAKLGAAKKGVPIGPPSPEHRAKLSASVKATKAAKRKAVHG